MHFKYIVAPTQNIAHYYAGKIGLSHRLVKAFADRHDIDRLRGISNLTILILNHYDCNEELLSFISILSTKANIKLEFENV